MKNYFNYFLILAALILGINLLVTACHKTPEKSKANLANILAKYNVEKPPHEHGKLMYSDVILQQISKTEYGIFLLEEDLENAAGNFFIVQSANLKPEKNMILRGAEILWMHNAILIQHAEKNYFWI